MQRVLRMALVVVAVVVVALAGYIVVHHSTVPDAGQIVGVTAQPSEPAPPSSTSVAPDPVIAFLGDDWTLGVGASSPAKRFTTLLSSQLHLVERNFGADGSGYAKSGPTAGDYASRITALVQSRPAIIVVSGGRNDRDDYTPTLDAQIGQLFTQLHAALPHAVLVGVAPMWGDSDLPPELAALDPVIQAAVTKAGGVYLGIADPIHGHPEEMADAADPNDQGYAAIAAALEPLLAPLIQR